MKSHNPVMFSYLRGIFVKTIDDDKESSILCDFCNSWIHPKCNHLNFLDFQCISSSNSDPLGKYSNGNCILTLNSTPNLKLSFN